MRRAGESQSPAGRWLKAPAFILALQDRTVRVRRAIALRSRLACLLADHSCATGKSCADPEWSAEDWKLVLAGDCCAIAALAALRNAGLLDRLRPEVRDVIRAARAEEAQRVAMARAILVDLAAVAAKCDAPLLLLKGGAYLASSPDAAIDLGDVDVAVPERDAPAVWEALLRAGWRCKEQGNHAARGDAPPALGDQWLPLIHPLRGSVPLELHRRVTYDGSPELTVHARRLAIDGMPGVTRATGAATFEAYLRHCVLSHSLRRGHLRDVSLLATVWKECTAEEQATVAAAVRRDAAAPELEAMLAAIRAFAAGETYEEDDSIKRAVARKYLLLDGEEGTLSRLVSGWWQRSYPALEEAGKRRRYIAGFARAGLTAFDEQSPIWREPDRSPGGVARGAMLRALRVPYRSLLATILLAGGPWMRWRVASVM